MSTTRPPRGAGISIAKRALELALDPGVTPADGTDHLIRLARGGSAALEHALAELEREYPARSDREHACILLRHAMDQLARPPLLA
jgi:hypothetical protein